MGRFVSSSTTFLVFTLATSGAQAVTVFNDCPPEPTLTLTQTTNHTPDAERVNIEAYANSDYNPHSYIGSILNTASIAQYTVDDDPSFDRPSTNLCMACTPIAQTTQRSKHGIREPYELGLKYL